MFRTVLISLIAFSGFSSPAFAKGDGKSHIYGGVTGGTLGIGPEIGYRLNDHFGVRANATFLSISHGIDSDSMRYDGDIRLQSGGAMVDVYPFTGGFRISGGFRINGNRGRAKGVPTSVSTFTIAGRTYSTAQIGDLKAETDIKNFAPALTIGYAGGARSGFVFGVEAGALFQDRIAIKPLTYTGPGFGNAALDARLAADLEQERQSVQNDIDDYKVYPILQLTLGYRF